MALRLAEIAAAVRLAPLGARLARDFRARVGAVDLARDDLSSPEFQRRLASGFLGARAGLERAWGERPLGALQRIVLARALRLELQRLGYPPRFAEEVARAFAEQLREESPTAPSARRVTALRDCRHGRLIYLRQDLYVGRSLERYGEYSELELERLHAFLSPGAVVVEAGANIGAHTIPLARAVAPSGCVIAYEPQRFVFQILCANAALNELANVFARHAAAGREAGRATVPLVDFAKSGNFGAVALGAGSGESVAVEAIDDLALARLDLLKADVEGMEADVLAGAAATIARCRPVLYVENDRREKSAALISLIREFGYRLWWHMPPLYNSANFDGRRENVFGGIVSINLLCLPRERETHAAQDLREVTSASEHPLD